VRCITETITDDNVAEPAGQKQKLDMAWADSGWRINITKRPLAHSPQLVPARRDVSDEIIGYESIFKKLHGSGHFPLKAVILYETFEGAMQAASALRQIAAGLCVDVDWHIAPWRLGLLKFAPTADKALDKTEQGHLLLIANLAIVSLSLWLKNWLKRWALLRQIRHAALAIMHDETSGDFSAGLAAELSELAEKCGLRFIGNFEIAQQHGSTDLSHIATKRVPRNSRKQNLSVFGQKSRSNYGVTIGDLASNSPRCQISRTFQSRTRNHRLV
jgi:hypothetical protein